MRTLGGVSKLPYDRLILASGSQLRCPNLQGFDRFTFNVDTYDEAVRLEAHPHDLCTRSSSIARDHVVVVGAGLTGIEVACEMPERLKKNGLPHGKVTLIDALPNTGFHMGDDARPIIEEALSELGICTRTNVSVKSFDHNGVLLVDGERIETHTIIWADGLQASNLAKDIPANTDGLGRLLVDKYLRVSGTADIFAAGDIAAAPVEDGYVSVMSCQHSRPMGRFAGHNAVAELGGHGMTPLGVSAYGTCLDLGPWGAVRTEGSDAKAIKTHINRDQIYPPRSQDRSEILESGRPEAQSPPPK